MEKRTMDARRAQQLINAQVEINRAIHMMNRLNDPTISEDHEVGDIERHAALALGHLHDVLNAMCQRSGLVQVRAMLPEYKAYLVRRWEQSVFKAGQGSHE